MGQIYLGSPCQGFQRGIPDGGLEIAHLKDWIDIYEFFFARPQDSFY